MSNREDPCKPYMDYAQEILDSGMDTGDRTGTGTRSLFGDRLKIDASSTAPFLTQRKLPLRSVIGELLWFIEGSVNTDILVDDYKCNFWNEWSSDITRTIGPMYGKLWRDCDGVDQLGNLLKDSATDPTSRRLIVDVWNAKYLPDTSVAPKLNPESGLMALAPCHFAYQLKLYQTNYDTPTYSVSLSYSQRSLDFFLGAPNNIASYYILLRLICGYLTKVTGHKHSPDKLIVQMGDAHVYNNHIEATQHLLSREPSDEAPNMIIDDEAVAIFESYFNGEFYKSDDLPATRAHNLKTLHSKIVNYKPQSAIKGERNV